MIAGRAGPPRLWRGGGAPADNQSGQPPALAGGRQQGTRTATALALRPPPAGAARALRSVPLLSAPAPLARAVAVRVPHGWQQLSLLPSVCSASRTLGRPALPLRGRAGGQQRLQRRRPPPRLCWLSGVRQASRVPLLALQARCKGENRFGFPLCTPLSRCHDPALRAVMAMRAGGARGRGADRPPLLPPSGGGFAVAALRRTGRYAARNGLPRRSRDAPAHCEVCAYVRRQLAAPIARSPRAPETRRPGRDRWPGLVTVRGHCLRRLYRKANPIIASLCCKYRLGSGGGAPRPPSPPRRGAKKPPALLSLIPLRTSGQRGKPPPTAYRV